MRKNEEYTGTVLRLGSNGEGILKEGDVTVFVPYALPEEKIRYLVLKEKGNVAYGKLLETIAPAEERVRPKCPYFGKCGGCQLQHYKYQWQLRAKRKTVEDCLSKIAFLSVKPGQTICSEEEYGYRNKLQLPVREKKDGSAAVGFFAPNSHRVIEAEDCAIQPDWCKQVISVLKTYLNRYRVPAYNEETHSGLIRHLVVRGVENELLITIVGNGKTLPHSDELIALLKEKFSSFSLFYNVNTRTDNVIFGRDFRLLYGKEKVIAKESGLLYAVGPESFLQVNDGVRRKIYRDVLAQVQADEDTTVIDAYSGAGFLTALFALKCRKAIGVEIVREAVDCADELCRMNGLEEKMTNICADCGDVLADLVEKERKESGKLVLVLDPPRQGVDEKILSAVLKSMPDKIVYVSCSPQTLARDLGLLEGTLIRTEKGIVKAEDPAPAKYEIVYLRPYDMFPQTKHVETLVVLSHKKPDSHIEVKIDFDNTSLDKSAIAERAEKRKPKDKPTYKDIQDWVDKNYGFKVHTAYIAEVKRNEGLPMYDAPNAVEELKHPRPHPTPKMVEAIRQALKHFDII